MADVPLAGMRPLPEWQRLLAGAGQGAVLSGGRRLPVRAGDSFVIPCSVPSLTLHAEGAPLGVTIARRD